MDRQVGRLRGALEAAGLLDRSWLVFTADHGETFLDRGIEEAYAHRPLRGEVTRVPLILRRPDGRPLGRSNALVASLDLAPTLAQLAGASLPDSWSGLPLLTSQGGIGPVARDHLVLEAAHRREVAVRTPNWLYRELRPGLRSSSRIQQAQGYARGLPFELYDVAGDPDERRNLYAPDHPAAMRLAALLGDYDRRTPSSTVALQMEPELLRALDAVGYAASLAEEPEPAARNGAAP